MKKKHNVRALAGYSTLALGIISSNHAESQVIYTDIDPDSTLHYTGDHMQFDFNDDAIPDLDVSAFYGPYVYVFTYSSSSFSINQFQITPDAGCEILVDLSGTPKILSAGMSVESVIPYAMFTNASEVDLDLPGYAPGFIAFRFSDIGGMHYGWLRLIESGDSVELLDYAYELSDATPILTHEPNTPYPVNNIISTDIANAHNPSDIQISFDVPVDESNIYSYRIFIEPDPSLNLETANALGPEAYTEVFPDGTNKSLTLNADQVDRFGNPINEFDFLYVSVEAVSIDQPEESVLTKITDHFIYGYKVQPVEEIIPFQTAGAVAYTSLKVNFVSPSDIGGILNYFTLVVPYSELPVTDSLFYFTNNNRIVLNDFDVPGGIWLPSHTYTAGVWSKDVHGDDIEFGVPYSVCVQSHTLWDNYTDYQYENLACSNSITLVDPGSTIENNDLNIATINMVGNEIQIQINTGISLPCSLQIFDMEGRIVLENKLQTASANFYLQLPAANYIAVLQTGEGKISREISIK